MHKKIVWLAAVLDIRLMLQFALVAEELSFTGAARRMGLAQPWLSARIRSLEEELGVALFERASRKIALTPAGERLYAAVRPLVMAVESFGADLEEIKRDNAPTVRVGTPGINLRDLAQVKLLDRFERLNPRVTLRVERGVTPSLIDRLQRGKLDIIFAVAPRHECGLESKPFSYQTVGLAMRRADPLASCSAISPESLAGRRVAVHAHSLTAGIDRFLTALADAGVRLDPQRELHESMLYETQAEPGLLLFTIIPEDTDPLEREHVVCRPIVGAPRIQIDLVRRRLTRHPPARQRFWQLAEAGA